MDEKAEVDDLAYIASSVSSIKLVTYNVFGLKVISKYRRQRCKEIGRLLANASPAPEIVALQECWTQEDYRSIRQQTRSCLPYAKYYYSGIFGGGLAILSKWPIEESTMLRYPLNGRPSAVFRGDWFVGKGVACAKIRMGPRPKDIVEVFSTHMHAPYEENRPDDSYICHRTSQAWEIAKLMKGAAQRGHLVIGMGDFNMLPLSLAHRLIEAHAPVKDAWRVLHPNSSVGPVDDPREQARQAPLPSARFNLTENGAASDNILNTWRWSKQEQKKLFKGANIVVDDSKPDVGAKRLDYIFIGGEEPYGSKWLVREIKVGMTGRHPELKCSLSDHFSVEATISHDSSLSASAPHQLTTPTNFDASDYDAVLEKITSYEKRQARQRSWQIRHFILSVIITVGCHLAVWWSPRNFVSFILMLLSTVGLGTGLLDGIIGGLFSASEGRALKEFEWEIKNAKSLYTHGPRQ